MESETEQIGNQYLSFSLRGEDYAVEIYKVREVLDLTNLTKIPRMPDYLCGVLNLRGNVVPVVDLGLKLGMPPFARTINTCIMIAEVEVETEPEPVMMGLITDTVEKVLDIGPENIEPVPRMGMNVSTDFIKGMGRLNEDFLIILDLDTILASEGQAIISEMGEQSGDAGGQPEDALQATEA